jgi:hypothetical protein
MINQDLLHSLVGRLKIFWISMALVFFVVSLQYLGIHGPNIFPLMSTKIQTYLHPPHEISYSSVSTHIQNTKKGGEQQ